MDATSGDTSLTPEVAAALAASPALRALDNDILQALVCHAPRVRLAEGQTLFRQGETGDAMYVLVRGALGVEIENGDGTKTRINRIAPGGHVGEMALLTGQPRTATVSALADSELLRLSKETLDAVADQQPELVPRLAESILPLFRRTQLIAILTRLFGQLDETAIHDLEPRFEWLTLRGGDVLIRQGDRGDAMFIVVTGRLRVVVVDDNSVEHFRGEVAAGQIVGEFALLTDEPRTATVFAIRDTTVVSLSRDAFEQVMMRYPRGSIEMTRLVLRQRHDSMHRLESRTSALSCALVPLGPSVRISDFAERLANVFKTFGPTLRFDGARMDEAYGKPGIAHLAPEDPLNASLLAWLDERERQHRYVVYEADGGWSHWTQRCIRQADRVLLVANADDDAGVTEIEVAMRTCATNGRKELVLLHPERRERPARTRRWLDRRDVTAHHHVRPGNNGDLERLARRLTGQAWGLVLSGGGVRGYAHGGVYRALVEAGIPVDVVGGTSMGAIIAGFVAMGLDYDSMRSLGERLSSPLKVFDPTLPVVALFSSAKVTSTLMELYGETEIEDLWRPFFSVSSNLTRAVQSVHRRGPLWRAVRASMAIPGIFSPILCDGELHVDGAVLNNLPIDVMREVNQGGPTVAVNVVPDVDLATPYQFGPSISGPRALVSMLNPIDTVTAPLIFDNLIRVLSLNEVQRAKAKRHLATIYICPPVGHFGLLDFRYWPDIVEAGYRAGVEAIAAWRSQENGARPERYDRVTTSANNAGAVQQLHSVLDQLEEILGA